MIFYWLWERYARYMGIKLGEVRAIGAVSKARVGFYDQSIKNMPIIDLARASGDLVPGGQCLLEG